MSDSLRPHGLQHARPPCPSPAPGVYSNPCPLSWWCHPTISSSVVSFSFHLQFFPASGSFQMSQLIASGGQSIGVSASTSVLPMNTQDWSPLGWTGWIYLSNLLQMPNDHRVVDVEFLGNFSCSCKRISFNDPLTSYQGFPGSSAGKESACSVGDLSLIPRLGRSPREGNSYPCQYSGLENSMDCIVQEAAKSLTWLSDFHFHFQLWWCSQLVIINYQWLDIMHSASRLLSPLQNFLNHHCTVHSFTVLGQMCCWWCKLSQMLYDPFWTW